MREMEFLIRKKNLMKINYHTVWKDSNDAKFQEGLVEVRRDMEQGPVKSGGEKSGYVWTEEFEPVKELFLLELTALDAIYSCKRAGLLQDHISASVHLSVTQDKIHRRN
mmetsp:Transcript_18128/g.13177  ORF Transcript_18128/g.13177 Transcript_18128/m.13177 type:complete len:109 (-) Transcript_18128:128-454(-)